MRGNNEEQTRKLSKKDEALVRSSQRGSPGQRKLVSGNTQSDLEIVMSSIDKGKREGSAGEGRSKQNPFGGTIRFLNRGSHNRFK